MTAKANKRGPGSPRGLEIATSPKSRIVTVSYMATYESDIMIEGKKSRRGRQERSDMQETTYLSCRLVLSCMTRLSSPENRVRDPQRWSACAHAPCHARARARAHDHAPAPASAHTFAYSEFLSHVPRFAANRSLSTSSYVRSTFAWLPREVSCVQDFLWGEIDRALSSPEIWTGGSTEYNLEVIEVENGDNSVIDLPAILGRYCIV